MTAIELLCDVEAVQEEAIERTFALLPIVNDATECLARVVGARNLFCRSSASRGLLDVASVAFAQYCVRPI